MSHTSTIFTAEPGKPLSARPLHAWLLFVAIAVTLIVTTWNVIGAAGYELADFAANSLLIQEAKTLSLFRGNYSRVGFNHPGPAILYVLTAGEVLFYDWLHLTRTAMAGQLLAVALYSAMWLTLMYRILVRMTGAATMAVLALAVFAFAASLLDYRVFTGAWFPHLYFFPFAVMLLAAARLVDGRADALPSLALSCGFLINGHVSFVAILGIVFLTVVASNGLLIRLKLVQGPFIIGSSFYRQHRRAIHAFALILSLFLLPLLVETVLHFPGPVAEYAAFSGRTKHNSLEEAITYLGLYWGGTRFAGSLALVYFAILLAYARQSSEVFGSAVRALVAVFIGASLALLFYAKVGIDLLQYTYIGLFYYTVPALAVMCGVIALASAQWRERSMLLIWISILLCGAVVYSVREPIDYRYQYSQEGTPQLYNSLQAIPHKGRMVLELENGKDPGFIWASMLGLQAYAKRHGPDLFCINSNWHISNTKAARCTREELARQPRYRVWKSEEGAGPALAQGMGLSVARLEFPDLSTMGELTVKDRPDIIRQFVIDGGWSEVEPEIVWSLGPTARLNLHTAPNFSGTITLQLEAFLPKPDADQILTVRSPNVAEKVITFKQESVRQRIQIPFKADADGLALVDLQIDHPVSPQAAGLSADPRALGVALRSILITKQ